MQNLPRDCSSYTFNINEKFMELKMRFYTLAILIILVAAIGCSGSESPVIPVQNANQISKEKDAGNLHGPQLWEFYEAIVNLDDGTIEFVEDRTAMFAANVVNFLNNNPNGLQTAINSITPGPGYVDVDVDVTIVHPLNVASYDGYDVAGVFIGNGSSPLKYNGNMIAPANGVDQVLLNSDGYTRWYNPGEFQVPGLFGYTIGNYASPGYNGSATLNGYKYFGQGLNGTGDLWAYLTSNGSDVGSFLHGTSNTRNYLIRFPVPNPDVVFNYAVIANWGGQDPSDHPAHAIEPVAVDVTQTPDVYYVNDSDFGGSIKLDLSVYAWGAESTGGAIDYYDIVIESNVLDTPYTLNDTEMVPVGSGEHYFDFHVEIPVDIVQATDGNEFWVLLPVPGQNYSNSFGVPNDAAADTLTAAFRFELNVLDGPIDNTPPTCDLQVVTSLPAEGWDSGVPVAFDATGSSDPDPGDMISYAWDFNNDGLFDTGVEDSYYGDPATPTHLYTSAYNDLATVKVTDLFDASSECSVNVEVTTLHQSKIIDVTNGANRALDLGGDPFTGDMLIYYDNGDVRKYSRSAWYTNFAAHTTEAGFEFIDVCGSGNYHILRDDGIFYTLNNYTNSGSLNYTDSDEFAGWPLNILDAAAFGSSGAMANRHGVVAGVDIPGAYHFLAYHYEHSTSGHSDFGGPIFPPFDGPSKVWPEDIVACETEAADYIWMLEANDGYVSRYTYGMLFSSEPNGYWGTGTNDDSDDGYNDPLDLARDPSNNFYILDHLSTGDYVIKSYSWDGTDTASRTSFGTPSDFSIIPVRLEGSEFDGGIAVLMDNGSASAISFFSEDEILLLQN